MPDTQPSAAEMTQQLVHQHLDWVYGLALRHTRNPHLAEDITQAVLLLLHRKRPHENSQVNLTGWLFRTTQLMALEALRKKIRRDYHEKRAAEAREEQQMSPQEDAWEEILPHLDAAVAQLPTLPRNLILLRFYRQLPFAEVALHLGITENAAKKRMARTLEQLQSTLLQRGGAPDFDLAAILAFHLASRAPESLATGTLSLLSGSVQPAVGVTLLCNAAKLAATVSLLKVAAVIVVLAALGITIAILTRVPHSRAASSAPAPASVTAAAAPSPTAQQLRQYRFLLPDGKPAADAMVLVGSAGITRVELSNLSLSNLPQGATRLRTDADGIVSTKQLVKDRDTLYVFHADGWLCETPERLQAGRDQQLLPWSRIEGTLADANGPMPGRTVRIWHVFSHSSLDAMAYTTATTDQAGRFVLDHLMAGSTCRLTVDSLPWSRDVQLLPGQVLPLSLREIGAILTGRVAAPESPFFGNYPVTIDLTAQAKENADKITFYKWAFLPSAKKTQFIKTASTSGDWQRYVDDLNRQFDSGKTYKFACMYANPTFRLPALAPGTWQLEIRALGYEAPAFSTVDDSLASLTTTVTITNEATHDLGEIKLPPILHLDLGDKLEASLHKTLTAQELMIPGPDMPLTVAVFGGYVDGERVKQIYESVSKEADVEFVEFIVGKTYEGYVMRFPRPDTTWNQVYLPDWYTGAFRRTLGLRANSGDPIVLVFGKDGTLLARHDYVLTDPAKLLQAARERLADSKKLTATAPKPRSPEERARITKTPSSDYAPAMQMEIAPKPAPVVVATPATVPAASLGLDLTFLQQAQCITRTSDSTITVVDKARGLASQSAKGRQFTRDGYWYCVPTQGKSIRAKVATRPEEPFNVLLDRARERWANSRIERVPASDKTVDGERWLAGRTGPNALLFFDEKHRLREIERTTFGAATAQTDKLFAPPAADTLVDIDVAVARSLGEVKPLKQWTYEGNRYQLYPLATRSRQWTAFAILHQYSGKSFFMRTDHLQDNYQLRRQTDSWLCIRIASVSVAPMQLDWYVATPTAITPDLAGDLKFYMHPFSRPFRTGPDGKMLQEADTPETISLPLPQKDAGPDLATLTAGIHSALSTLSDTPTQARIIREYFGQVPFNDGSEFDDVTKVTADAFAATVQKLTGAR